MLVSEPRQLQLLTYRPMIYVALAANSIYRRRKWSVVSDLVRSRMHWILQPRSIDGLCTTAPQSVWVEGVSLSLCTYVCGVAVADRSSATAVDRSRSALLTYNTITYSAHRFEMTTTTPYMNHPTSTSPLLGMTSPRSRLAWAIRRLSAEIGRGLGHRITARHLTGTGSCLKGRSLQCPAFAEEPRIMPQGGGVKVSVRRRVRSLAKGALPLRPKVTT